MKIALEENDKLMDRYRKVEAELQASHWVNKEMKGQFDEKLNDAQNRVKLTQDQALSQMKQMKETQPVKKVLS